MGDAGGFGSFRHLVGRFFGALDPRGPAAPDENWALQQMLPGEQELWRQMSGPDRRHAIGVARDVVALLRPDPANREVIAAALLHDVGKVDSGLGTFSRVGVTILAMAVGRDRLSSSPRSRITRYLTHDQIGGKLLRQAGSDPLTANWAEQHHLDPNRWTLDRRVANALKAADGD